MPPRLLRWLMALDAGLQLRRVVRARARTGGALVLVYGMQRQAGQNNNGWQVAVSLRGGLPVYLEPEAARALARELATMADICGPDLRQGVRR